MLTLSIISYMKILRLSTFLDFGGVETRLATISHVQDENEWIFVCMDREGKAAEIIQKNKKRLINLNTKPTIYRFQTFLCVYKIIKKEKPDVVHTSGAEANFHGILAAKLAGVPKIIGEEIGIPNHSKKAQVIFSVVYRFANFVVGNSKTVLDVVHSLDNVPIKKLRKIDNPILFKDLKNYKHHEATNEFQMIMISRLEAVKNIEGVLNVLGRIKNETKFDVKLRIAGSGQSENLLKQKVKDLGLENEVDFLGFISEPYPYLLNADLYILNSHSEGFSNSLVEAMYSKTPSLSTAVGAAPEIIQDGVNGFLTPVNDEEAFYQKLISILGMSKDRLSEIGLSGHDKIIKNFSLENHLKKLLEIYK